MYSPCLGSSSALSNAILDNAPSFDGVLGLLDNSSSFLCCSAPLSNQQEKGCNEIGRAHV